MRKTRLSLDVLEVETFQTEPAPAGPRGTVHGHNLSQVTSYCHCDYATNYGTCQATCQNSCAGPTCDDPCNSGDDTCYVTCIEGCGWTFGNSVCLQTRQC